MTKIRFTAKEVHVFTSGRRPKRARLPLVVALALPLAGVACGTRVQNKEAATGSSVTTPSGPTSAAVGAEVVPNVPAGAADAEVQPANRCC